MYHNWTTKQNETFWKHNVVYLSSLSQCDQLEKNSITKRIIIHGALTDFDLIYIFIFHIWRLCPVSSDSTQHTEEHTHSADESICLVFLYGDRMTVIKVISVTPAYVIWYQAPVVEHSRQNKFMSRVCSARCLLQSRTVIGSTQLPWVEEQWSGY